MAVERYGSLPFDEAVAFFRAKVNVPTARWADLWQEQHDTGFMVAGAAKAELLADLRAAVDKSIATGTTLEEFRRDFDGLVERHGWTYRGGRAWRTEVIYKTNLRTAYAAGRFQQMTQPDVLADRPFWEYRHGDSRNPRKEHVAWDGKVIPAADPWWKTHYPPCGWGCNCKAFALSADDLADMGKGGPDVAPPEQLRSWTDKVTGEVHQVPAGVDPGWGYTPGRSVRAAQLFVDKTGEFPADLGAAMMAEGLEAALPGLRAGFDAWAGEVFAPGYQPKGAGRVVGALTPTTVAQLTAIGSPPARAAVLVTDRELLHMARSVKAAAGKAVPVATLRQMPDLIAAPRAVLWDKSDPGLLFVFDGPPGDPRLGKLVVRIDHKLRERSADGQRVNIAVNHVRTAGLVPRVALTDVNRYDVIEGAL